MFKTIDEIGKRYRFKTSLPIVGDEEGLMLTSYQCASEHTATRIVEKLGSTHVLELCCGVGGTTVFLADQMTRVYSVDINSSRLKAAKVNLKTFGVEEKVSLIHGDITDENLLKNIASFNIRAVVTDVEWRSDLADSLIETTPDINKTIPSTPALFEKINRLVSKNIVMHMAANTDKRQLKELGDCEIEEMVYQRKVKFINVYFGELINKIGITKYIID